LNDTSAATNANGCFVCGPENPIGLRVRFRLEGDLCVGEFTPEAVHVGFPSVVHGGILFSLLDDVMANALYLNGIWAYTARCEIRFRKPLKVGQAIRLEGREIQRRGRKAVIEGKALRCEDGLVIAESEATFVIRE
jgi:acyl-coenzyme A thioesterase PaaI-like protein